MLKPVCLNCGHSGCQDCMQKLITTIRVRPKCPICRVEIGAQTLSLNIALDNITRELPVQCVTNGCNWNGLYGNAAEHFDNCPKVQIECPNEGCQHMSVREDMAAHAGLCIKRKLPCPDCNKSVTWETMPHHQSSRCANAVVQCPLGCSQALPRYVD